MASSDALTSQALHFPFFLFFSLALLTGAASLLLLHPPSRGVCSNFDLGLGHTQEGGVRESGSDRGPWEKLGLCLGVRGLYACHCV